VFDRTVGDHPIERSIPIPGDPIINEVDVEAVTAAVPDLLGGVTVMPTPTTPRGAGPVKERPVPATDVQQSVAGLNTAPVQQVIVLIRLGLLKRQQFLTY